MKTFIQIKYKKRQTDMKKYFHATLYKTDIRIQDLFEQ